MLKIGQKSKDRVLLEAITNGTEQDVEKAIAAGALPGAILEDKTKLTGLHLLAANTGDYRACNKMRVLLKAGAPVDVLDAKGETPFYIAVEKDSSLAGFLMREGKADPTLHPAGAPTAFRVAVARRDMVLLKTMIDAGLAEAMSDEDVNRLICECLMSRTRNASYYNSLLSLTKDIHAHPSLPFAVLDGVTEVDSDWHASSVRDAEEKNAFLKDLFVTLLGRPEADVNLCKGKRSILEVAVGKRAGDIAELLLDRGAFLSLDAAAQQSCFNKAVKAQSVRLVARMMKAADHNGLALDYGSALLAAAGLPVAGEDKRSQSDYLCARLVRAGADVNTLDADGRTPLMIAVMQKTVSADACLCVDKLLSLGADAAIRDANGMTAYDHARQKGDRALIDILARQEPDYVSPPDPNRYKKVSDNAIAVRDGTLVMTFNFWAQQVIYTVDPDGKNTAPPAAMTVCGFADIPRAEAVQEAYETLRRLGGNPPAWSGMPQHHAKPKLEG